MIHKETAEIISKEYYEKKCRKNACETFKQMMDTVISEIVVEAMKISINIAGVSETFSNK